MRATLLTLVFGGVFLFGALKSDDPLMRIACWGALVSSACALVAAKLASAERLNRPTLLVWVVMLGSFTGTMVVDSRLGGGALNGRVENGHYYLASHGHTTLVSKRTYYLVGALEGLLFVSWPAGLILAGGRSGRHERAR